MKSESELKSDFVKKVRLETAQIPGWYARRIEDQYAVGIPDMLFGIPSGQAILIEAKRVLTGTAFAPTARQWIELQRWRDPGNTIHNRFSFMMAFKDRTVYIGDAAEKMDIRNCVASEPGEKRHEFLFRAWRRIYHGI